MVKIKKAQINDKVRSLLKQLGIRFLFRPTQQQVLIHLYERYNICIEIKVGVYKMPSDWFTHTYWSGRVIKTNPAFVVSGVKDIVQIGPDLCDYSSCEDMIDDMLSQAIAYLLSDSNQ